MLLGLGLDGVVWVRVRVSRSYLSSRLVLSSIPPAPGNINKILVLSPVVIVALVVVVVVLLYY